MSTTKDTVAHNTNTYPTAREFLRSTQSLPTEPRVVTFSDLTVDGQKSFSMAWTFYQDTMKAYD